MFDSSISSILLQQGVDRAHRLVISILSSLSNQDQQAAPGPS